MKTLIEEKFTHSTPTEVRAGEDPNQSKETERDAGSNEPRPDPANQRAEREWTASWSRPKRQEARAGRLLTSPLAPESNRMEARRIAVRKREDWDSASWPPVPRAENELGFCLGRSAPGWILVGGVESMAEASETREGFGNPIPGRDVAPRGRAATRSLVSTWARRRADARF